MQVCSPQDIRQAHSQNPPNSRVSLEKPLSLTWLRTKKQMYYVLTTIWFEIWLFENEFVQMNQLKPAIYESKIELNTKKCYIPNFTSMYVISKSYFQF